MIAKIMMFAASACLALAGCSGNNSSSDAGAAAPQEIGQFGVVVGQPVATISATRGNGASVDFDQFTVTFNNAEGTSITVTTPEGEQITFDEADPATFTGPDRRLPGAGDVSAIELTRLVSDRGDELEVIIGVAQVPVAPEEPGNGTPVLSVNDGPATEDREVFAVARLDEHDTRDGFETYAVVGELTDPANLPRNDEGNLIEGTASYQGDFVATVFQSGQVVSDEVSGYASVDIDFADNEVGITLSGSYLLDDIDDRAESFVTGTDAPTTLISTDVVDGMNNPTNVDVVNSVTDQFGSDNSDRFNVSLSGFGTAADIDFNTGGTYTGTLDGYVDVPSGRSLDPIRNVDVAGEFGGAVFGPGESAFDVLDTADTEFPARPSQIIDATGTAGVFEANSNDDPSLDNADVEIVGGFAATSGGFCGDCSVPR